MKISTRFKKPFTAAKQKGFTLIELAIVGLFLGILVVFAVSRFTSGGVDTQRAAALNDTATKIADTWSTLQSTCNVSSISGVSLATVSTPSVAAANLSLLLGTATPAAAYQACYSSSGIKPLSGLVTGAQGAEQTTNSLVPFGVPSAGTVNGNPVLNIVLGTSTKGVPESVVLGLYRKLSNTAGADAATSLPTTSAAGETQIQFGAASATGRIVTLIKPL